MLTVTGEEQAIRQRIAHDRHLADEDLAELERGLPEKPTLPIERCEELAMRVAPQMELVGYGFAFGRMRRSARIELPHDGEGYQSSHSDDGRNVSSAYSADELRPKHDLAKLA